MSALLWRVLIAIVCVILVNMLLMPVASVLGFPLSGNVLTIVRVCVMGLAVLYILSGRPVSIG